MQIISKADADRIRIKLICAGKAVEKGKFCTGKYKWTAGGSKDHIGKKLVDLPDVKAVWVERRQDREGPYAQLMSYSVRQPRKQP